MASIGHAKFQQKPKRTTVPKLETYSHTHEDRVSDITCKEAECEGNTNKSICNKKPTSLEDNNTIGRPSKMLSPVDFTRVTVSATMPFRVIRCTTGTTQQTSEGPSE